MNKNNNISNIYLSLIIGTFLILIVIPAFIMGKLYFGQSENDKIRGDKVLIYNGSGKQIKVLNNRKSVEKYSLPVGYGTKNAVSPILKGTKIPSDAKLIYKYRIYKKGNYKYLQINIFNNTKLAALKNVDLFGNVVTRLNENQYEKYIHP